ncbi:MAG: flagellar basal body P-ring formation chaperone FlgA [bacterium]|nr:flagellar basal body P-ring formation chaperone FlgA [bacterium]
MKARLQNTLIILLLPLLAFCQTISLKEDVEVSGKEIFLSDIAEYSGEEIKIGVSPLIGRTRTLKRQYIELVAKRRIPDLKIIGNEVRVRRACQNLPKERLQEEIIRAIPEKGSITVGNIPELFLAKGELSFDVEPIVRENKATCKVLIKVNGVEHKRIMVDCKIQKFSDVVVAKKDILSGSLIKAEDIEMAYKEIEKEAGFSDSTDLVGKEARVLIKAGEAIKVCDVQDPVLIRFGDIVTLIKNGDGFTVTCEGKAASNGFLGKRIMVRNLSSNKLIEAVVLDSKTVEVR